MIQNGICKQHYDEIGDLTPVWVPIFSQSKSLISGQPTSFFLYSILAHDLYHGYGSTERNTKQSHVIKYLVSNHPKFSYMVLTVNFLPINPVILVFS